MGDKEEEEWWIRRGGVGDKEEKEWGIRKRRSGG